LPVCNINNIIFASINLSSYAFLTTKIHSRKKDSRKVQTNIKYLFFKKTPCTLRKVNFWIFLCLTTEFVFAKEFLDQSIKKAFLPGNEFLGPKSWKSH
jgi:hypothetical protein